MSRGDTVSDGGQTRAWIGYYELTGLEAKQTSHQSDMALLRTAQADDLMFDRDDQSKKAITIIRNR